ncbi:hypothetical protein QYF61_020129 [Mycteria americana]|uniref:Uncharacterized protein n=1 Tax=Mycteria americana TaxID=33587 RepID=A0AAN7NVP9_MYCAM|nr:hypothetical protein QYF61_020129 [Mycteria americana]
MFQYLKCGYKEDGDPLFTRNHMEKTRGNGYKLLLGRFRLDTRGKFFTMRTISHWNNLPRETNILSSSFFVIRRTKNLPTLDIAETLTYSYCPAPRFHLQSSSSQLSVLTAPRHQANGGLKILKSGRQQKVSHLINTVKEVTKGWRLNHFPGQPAPMLDNPFSEEIFPNSQSKPFLMQLKAISSHLTTYYLGKENNAHLTTTSFQVAVESNKVSPQPPVLQTKQPQFPQPFLTRLLLQTLHQLRCPSLDTLQHLNVPLVVGGPKLNTVFEVRPHQCREQGHDHFSSPAGHAIFDTSQDAIGFLGHLGTLLAHIHPAVNQHPKRTVVV